MFVDGVYDKYLCIIQPSMQTGVGPSVSLLREDDAGLLPAAWISLGEMAAGFTAAMFLILGCQAVRRFPFVND